MVKVVLELFNNFDDDVMLKMVKSKDARSNLTHSRVSLLATWTAKTELSVLFTYHPVNLLPHKKWNLQEVSRRKHLGKSETL